MTRALLTLAVVLLSCGPAPTTGGTSGVALEVASFTLEDVNPASARFGQQVTQADYAGKVTGWYFGHSS